MLHHGRWNNIWLSFRMIFCKCSKRAVVVALFRAINSFSPLQTTLQQSETKTGISATINRTLCHNGIRTSFRRSDWVRFCDFWTSGIERFTIHRARQLAIAELCCRFISITSKMIRRDPKLYKSRYEDVFWRLVYPLVRIASDKSEVLVALVSQKMVLVLYILACYSITE